MWTYDTNEMRNHAERIDNAYHQFLLRYYWKSEEILHQGIAPHFTDHMNFSLTYWEKHLYLNQFVYALIQIHISPIHDIFLARCPIRNDRGVSCPTPKMSHGYLFWSWEGRSVINYTSLLFLGLPVVKRFQYGPAEATIVWWIVCLLYCWVALFEFVYD